MGVSWNRCTPKSSILVGFSLINHPFGGTSISGNLHMTSWTKQSSTLEEGRPAARGRHPAEAAGSGPAFLVRASKPDQGRADLKKYMSICPMAYAKTWPKPWDVMGHKNHVFLGEIHIMIHQYSGKWGTSTDNVMQLVLIHHHFLFKYGWLRMHGSLRGFAKMGCALYTPNKLLRHHGTSYYP